MQTYQRKTLLARAGYKLSLIGNRGSDNVYTTRTERDKDELTKATIAKRKQELKRRILPKKTTALKIMVIQKRTKKQTNIEKHVRELYLNDSGASHTITTTLEG